MPAPFASLEARVNSVAAKRLANTTATFAAGDVDGVFDSDYMGALGMEASGPMFSCLENIAPVVGHGTSLIIGGVSYMVGNVRPDGRGRVEMYLQLAVPQ